MPSTATSDGLTHGMRPHNMKVFCSSRGCLESMPRRQGTGTRNGQLHCFPSFFTERQWSMGKLLMKPLLLHATSWAMWPKPLPSISSVKPNRFALATHH